MAPGELIGWEGSVVDLDLDPFYAKVKFGHIGFCMGKSENYLFFGNLQPWVSKLLEAFS